MPKRHKMLRAKRLAAKYEEEKKQRTKKKEKCETSTNREMERSASCSRRELRWRQQQFLEYRSLAAASECRLLTVSRTRSWSPVEPGYHPRVSQPGPGDHHLDTIQPGEHHEGPFAFKANPKGHERKK